MARNQQPPSVPRQEFDYKNTTNVSKAMIKAGTEGKSRIKAGVRAAWNAKVSSMYGEDTTKGAIALRLMGAQGLAKWYDRFMAKESKKQKDQESDGGGGDGGSSRKASVVAATGIKQLKGELKGLNRKLDVVFNVVSATRGDVSDIKSMLMPKITTIKGTSGKDRDVQFNPLAPQGNQFQDVTKSGALTHKKLSAKDKENASRRAALETAKLVLAMQKKDKATAELKQKYSYKDTQESYDKESEVEVLRKEMHERFDKLEKPKEKEGWLSKIGDIIGGLWTKIMDFFKNPLAILGGLAALMPMASLIGKAGLVGLAGYLGYELGSWLNDKFKLDEKINDAIQKAAGWFGKGDEAKIRASDKAAVDAKNAELAKINKQLEGTGYRKQEMKISEDGTTYSGGGYVDEKGNKVLEKDLPPNVKRQIGLEAGPVEAEPDIRKGPTSRGGRKGREEGLAPPTEITPTSAPAPTPPISAPAPTPVATSGELPAPVVGERPVTGELKLDTGPKISGQDDIKKMIKDHEGFRDKPYKDSRGLWTVGYGHLIGDGKTLPPEWNKQFSQKEMDDLFEEDYAHHRKAAEKIPGFSKLNDKGQGAITDLTFNMGPSWIKKFPSVAKALGEGMPNVAKAAQILENSLWYKQVARRGPRIVAMMRAGFDSFTGGGGGATPSDQVRVASAAPSPASTPASVTTTPATVTPAPSTSGAAIDKGSRELMASNASAPPVTMVSAPQVTNNNTNNTTAKRPMIKADVVNRDEAFVRSASRDAAHPVYG